MSLVSKPRAPAHLEALRGAVDRILAIQEPNGAIPWFENGAWDSWNHTESAMALNAAGEREAARAAFAHLRERQEADGSWLCEYGSAVPMADEEHMSREKPKPVRDTNFAAYCAVGIWHDVLLHRDRAEAKRNWEMVRRAMDFVLALQSPYGDVCWSADALGSEYEDALVAGNASIFKSLEAAIALGSWLGEDIGDLSLARLRLRLAFLMRPDRFDRSPLDRSGFAMDWYYPSLAGLITGQDAIDRIARGWDKFFVAGRGCRCVAHEPWVTVAETAELALALLAVGDRALAETALNSVLPYTDGNGAFWMGWQFAADIHWPTELPSWTQAAVLLAADALHGEDAASQLLVRHAACIPSDEAWRAVAERMGAPPLITHAL